jgi:hypothetical protein
MNKPDHISESLETISWVKYLNSVMRIRDRKNSDPGWKKFGSGMEKIRIRDPEFGINIPDPQHCKKERKNITPRS